MKHRNHHLHGSAPDTSKVALLLIDVVNDLEFPGNQSLINQAPALARNISRLKESAKAAGVPVIYVNDNFGRWRSDFQSQVRHCLQEKVAGKILVEKLKPSPEDYFVVKPKHSGFFATSLDSLLEAIGAQTLILAGVAGDRCVLFTASDAFLRDYEIFVPADCVASARPDQNAEALKLMQRVLKANVRKSTKLLISRKQVKI